MQQHDNDQDKSKNTWQTFKGRILSKKSNKHKFAVKFVQKTHIFCLFYLPVIVLLSAHALTFEKLIH